MRVHDYLCRRRAFSSLGVMSDSAIIVAGASGDLGGRITKAMLERGAEVRAMVRHSTAPDKVERLRELGAEVARSTCTAPPKS